MITLEMPVSTVLSVRERRVHPAPGVNQPGSTLTEGLRSIQRIYRPMPGSERDLEINGNQRAWVSPTLDQLLRLSALPGGWDSYGAKEIEPACINLALQIAFELMPDQAPPPTVVPTTYGGVQFEWHTRGIDLEIEIRSLSRISANFEDERTGEAWDDENVEDFGRVRQALRELARR